MANATQMATGTAHEGQPSSALGGRLTGLLIVCAAPAAFWTLLLALLGWAFGFEIAASALLASALSIATFLGVIFSVLTLNGRA
jgi:hypothetical protein